MQARRWEFGARHVLACDACRDPPDVFSTFKKLGRRSAESDKVLDSNLGNAGPATGPELPDSKQAAWAEAPVALLEQYLNSYRRGQLWYEPDDSGTKYKYANLSARTLPRWYNFSMHELELVLLQTIVSLGILGTTRTLFIQENSEPDYHKKRLTKS
ncbi:hypothetical protein FQA39_LY01308 [Lamprigera yunnana]|nr:hypothetical protein FQA39_LY01308 [Lamprigera yunnana]